MDENLRYFAVKTKCGHVGKNHYLPVVFAIKAKDRKEAASKARKIPRVKHDHKDAILEVTEISYDNFLKINEENSNNPYFHCKNKKEQKEKCADIKEKVVVDLHNTIKYYSKEERKERVQYKQKKIDIFLREIKRYELINVYQ